MYESSFRLRGKTYDYKIQYQSIKKFFILPKNDETHTLITMGLDPPLRQGQTRYPFIVMQLKNDEEVSIDLNMTEYVDLHCPKGCLTNSSLGNKYPAANSKV
jgi:structure-specific recognition protein 1